MAEKETLQREIDEKRAILDGVDEDVESRTKLLEEYAQMKVEKITYSSNRYCSLNFPLWIYDGTVDATSPVCNLFS